MFDFLRNLTKSAEEKRQEAITAYLDDTMSANERERFAAQLAQDTELQAAVARERAVKQSLSRLPQRRVPRNFTLDPARYGRPARQPLIQAYPVLRAATGLAAVFFIFALFSGYYLGGTSPSMAPAAESAGGAAMDTAVEQQVEITRVVTETVTEEEVMAGEEEPAAAEAPAFEEAVEEAAEVPAEAAPLVEEEETTEEEAVEAEEPAPEVPLPAEDGMTQNGEAPTGGEDILTPMPTATLAAAATPTAVPTPTAEFTDSAITTTMDTGDTREMEDGEIALNATALPLDEFAEGTAVPPQTEQPPSQPVNTLLIIQVGLLLLMLILGAITLYTRRQL